MIMAVVPRDEAEYVLHALIAAGHTATFTESRGGILRQAQYTLFIAVDDEDVKKVLTIIDENCHSQVLFEPEGGMTSPASLALPPRGTGTARVGGAVIFVWDLERFEIY
jgi:uncharacterized protein YaaQ